MPVNIYKSRRRAFYRCEYWKRKITKSQDNDEYIHEDKPDGVFYARIVGDKGKSDSDIAGVWHVGFEDLTLATEDYCDLSPNDIVEFDGVKWVVDRVSDAITQKRSEFSHKQEKTTTMTLRRSE